jgi:26S proteasome regulatory subunit N5
MIKEAEGDVAAACDIMLEVYVETFGALSKREKIDFILEQIRLCIAKATNALFLSFLSPFYSIRHATRVDP